MNNIFTSDWERRLEAQFLVNDRCRRRAYICSPLSGQTSQEMMRNMHNARAYMFYAAERMGLAARAPHAYLPMLLCDAVTAERALGLRFGQQLIEQSDLMLVCGNRLSSGMRGEIIYAASLNMPIQVFDDTLYPEIRKLVTQHRGNKKLVRMNWSHALMAFPEPEDFQGGDDDSGM